MDQCGIYSEFRAAVDCAAMNAALLEIWERYLLQCDRRAVFLNNGSESVSGFMGHVPIAARGRGHGGNPRALHQGTFRSFQSSRGHNVKRPRSGAGALTLLEDCAAEANRRKVTRGNTEQLPF
jgi:hypothetical protein